MEYNVLQYKKRGIKMKEPGVLRYIDWLIKRSDKRVERHKRTITFYNTRINHEKTWKKFLKKAFKNSKGAIDESKRSRNLHRK